MRLIIKMFIFEWIIIANIGIIFLLESNILTLKYLSYRHGQIAYVDTGEGPTLFLLHGMNGNSKSWANLFHSLNSSYRIIAWDAPSFGKSDVFGDTIEDYKNAAKALIETLKLKNIILYIKNI